MATLEFATVTFLKDIMEHLNHMKTEKFSYYSWSTVLILSILYNSAKPLSIEKCREKPININVMQYLHTSAWRSRFSVMVLCSRDSPCGCPKNLQNISVTSYGGMPTSRHTNNSEMFTGVNGQPQGLSRLYELGDEAFGQAIIFFIKNF